MINENLDWRSIHEEFTRKGRVRIENILQDDVAENIHQHLANNVKYQLDQSGVTECSSDLGDRLSLLSPNEQRAYTESLKGRGFGYKFYLYHAPVEEDSIVVKLREYLSSQAFRGFIYYITGERVNLVSGMPTCYRPGCYLTRHTDHDEERDYAELESDQTRYFAHVFGFTPYWEADWGGMLHFLDQEGAVIDVYPPGFNTLTLFRVPQDHFVSQVATYARANRYSITGWFFGKKSRRVK